MNVTSVEHFRKYFPGENIDGFDTMYYTQGSAEDFAFIALKGKMDDIRVFTHGNYEEESLERRIMELISVYGTRPQANESIVDDDVLWSGGEDVRADMISPPPAPMSETMWIAVALSLFTLLEASTLLLMHVMGVVMDKLFLIGAVLLAINIIVFLIFKKPYIPKGRDDYL